MCRIAAKFVPRLLTNDQERVNVCLELRKKSNKDPTFVSRIITGDESWIYGYDPETKQQSSQWKLTQSQRAKKGKSRVQQRACLLFFLDVKGVVHRKFVPLNTTINSDFYCDIFRRLKENVWRKTGTLTQPQLTPSSRQRGRQHVPENH
jgi:hypothetical protein